MKSRLVFRHDGHEIIAVIEGPQAWVKHFSDQIGLGTDSGWMIELTHGKGKDPLRPSSDEPILPGPPPDPSRIPAVIREMVPLILHRIRMPMGPRISMKMS